MPRNLFHLTVRQELHGQQVQNGYYFRSKEGVDASQSPGQVADFIIQRFGIEVLPKIILFANQQLKFQNLVVTTVSPKFQAVRELLLETSNGAQPDDSLPSYCAGLLSLRSGLSGGFHRGRSYYAGVSEGDCSDSRLIPDSFAALTSIGNSLLAQFGSTNPTSFCDYGIWSWKLATYDSGTETYNTDLAFTPISQCIARPVVATNRHRKIGHGN